MPFQLLNFVDLTKEQRVTLEAFERDVELCRTFYFIGGTLLKALGIVPRISNDLDFFSFSEIDSRSFAVQRIRLEKLLGGLFGRAVEATQQGFIHVPSGMVIDIAADSIKNIGHFIAYGNLKTASIEDSIANKASALCSRDEVKDLIDIAFLTKKEDLLLSDLETFAEKKFGLGTITEEKLLTELLAKREQFDIPEKIFLRDNAACKTLVARQIALLIEKSSL